MLAALVTLTLVATLAAAAAWQHWRDVEVESAERSRAQSAWVLTGALDWSRLILREDARSGGADHLGEPWATPLAEARLSSFLAQNPNETQDGPGAFLSGRITDAQARLNAQSLVDGTRVSPGALRAWLRLGQNVGVSEGEIVALAERLRLALDTTAQAKTQGPTQPLPPQRVEHLLWLGLSPAALQRLQPFITLLPVATPVNLNTASAEVLHAVLPGLDMSDALQLVQWRQRSPLNSLADVEKLLPALSGQLKDDQHAVASRFFLVEGRLRLDDVVVQERSLVQRNGLDVFTLWRERGGADALSTMSPSTP